MSGLTNPYETWKDSALCAQADPEQWFPARGQNDRLAAARAICAECPVARICLETAMAEEAEMGNQHRWGVRGGLTAQDRAKLAREREAA